MSLLPPNNNGLRKANTYPSFLPETVTDQVQQAVDLVDALNDPSRTDSLILLYRQEQEDLENVLDIIDALSVAKKKITKRLKLIDKSIMDLQPNPMPEPLPEVKIKRNKTRQKPETVPEDLENINALDDFD